MANKNNPILTLASGSPRRLDILNQANITPDSVTSPEIDETPLKHERPDKLALRLSLSKAQKVFQEKSDSYVLAADTVVACGQQIMDKPKDAQEARNHLKKLSGRRHQVHGGICLIAPTGKILQRHCKTLIQFKPLSDTEIEDYLEAGEWEGKAGAYAIQGYAGSFIKYLSGSYTNVVGLSLYDTIKMLKSSGYL